MDIKLGTIECRKPEDVDRTLALLLWGPPGAGKTTLAATAPGTKLWLLFDNDGDKSLIGRDDIIIADMSGEKHTITDKFKDDNPFGLEQVFDKNPEIETLVFDSITAYAMLCNESAVVGVKSATLENPGLKGYGWRNARVLRAVVSLMRLCKRKGKNIIIIGHEDNPEKTEDGTILHITVAIGGKMTNQLGLQLSEIWNLTEIDKGKRRIAIRPCRLRKPMKTRMFNTNGEPEFEWAYNPDTNAGMTISGWMKEWESGNFRKIAIPKA